MESPRGSIFARATDIALEGMFLETGGVALALYTPITVGFRFGDATVQNEFRLPAMVVRRASSGVGVLFLEMPSDVTEALHDALYREPCRPRAHPAKQSAAPALRYRAAS